jgi:hypothetical protein
VGDYSSNLPQIVRPIRRGRDDLFRGGLELATLFTNPQTSKSQTKGTQVAAGAGNGLQNVHMHTLFHFARRLRGFGKGMFSLSTDSIQFLFGETWQFWLNFFFCPLMTLPKRIYDCMNSFLSQHPEICLPIIYSNGYRIWKLHSMCNSHMVFQRMERDWLNVEYSGRSLRLRSADT